MRVFVTGATGFVGTAVVQELIKSGHRVLGLARSDANEKQLKSAGAEVHRGDLENLDSLRAGAKATDGVIHCGFVHDFARFKEVCEIDQRAIAAMGSALEGSQKPFVVTSGTALVNPGHLATEDMNSIHSEHPRVVSEKAAIALSDKGIRSMIVRLSISTHGEGDHGFVPMLISLAREKGVSAYTGDGANRWTGVHRYDAAVLYRLALEKGKAGSNFHAVGEEAIPFKEIATIIGKQLGIPVVSKSKEEAIQHFAWFASFAGLDCPASSKLTQERLGWKYSHNTLMSDLTEGSYFKK